MQKIDLMRSAKSIDPSQSAQFAQTDQGRNFSLWGNFWYVLTPYSIDTHLTHQQQTAFENIVGKGEIARYEQFLLFSQCFLLKQITR